MEAVRVLLISTYEMGRQPFGLASPAAWLRAEGHEVRLADLSRSSLPLDALREADLIGFFLPMHTATRLLPPVIDKVRAHNSRAHLCAFGLYAPLNETLLRNAGITSILGGEFEQQLTELALSLSRGERFRPAVANSSDALPHLKFLPPDRSDLPPLDSYARVILDSDSGESRVAGYTEASRGCKHLCRHCPIVPVYSGRFRVVQREVVLEDIRLQVAAGAEHVTFGDPDFFNGPAHAMALVEALHREWPALTYDVTIKIEHLLQHHSLLPALKATGCLFITSAVESLDDAVLERLAKGHTYTGFRQALDLTRAAGLPLSPTFIPFTPWTTRESYRRFLRELRDLGLAEQVAPVQLAIRLLIPEGSLLLELPEIREIVEPFDSHALCYPWRSPDPAVDALQKSIHRLVHQKYRAGVSREAVFRAIWELADCGSLNWQTPQIARAAIPYLTEPWYC
jgi:radical SAM superfamily enzyme YgiQ (UPF0313 family)